METPTGNTPFEKAQIGRVKAQLTWATHVAVKELVKQIDECETMIENWKQTTAKWSAGSESKEAMEADLMLATQALKDKKLFEEALVMICERAKTDLGLEA